MECCRAGGACLSLPLSLSLSYFGVGYNLKAPCIPAAWLAAGSANESLQCRAFSWGVWIRKHVIMPLSILLSFSLYQPLTAAHCCWFFFSPHVSPYSPSSASKLRRSKTRLDFPLSLPFSMSLRPQHPQTIRLDEARNNLLSLSAKVLGIYAPSRGKCCKCRRSWHHRCHGEQQCELKEEETDSWRVLMKSQEGEIEVNTDWLQMTGSEMWNACLNSTEVADTFLTSRERRVSSKTKPNCTQHLTAE